MDVVGWEVVTSKTKPEFSWRCTAEGQEAMDRSDYKGNSVLQRKEFPMRALSIQMDAHRGFWKFSEFSWTTQQDP